jgi:hypothetical protein
MIGMLGEQKLGRPPAPQFETVSPQKERTKRWEQHLKRRCEKQSAKEGEP